MATPSGKTLLRLAAALSFFPPFLAQPALAQGGDKWAAHESEPRATLPAAQGETRVSGGVLSCDAQRWRLDLTVADGAELSDGDVLIEVDKRAFEARAVAADGALSLALPRAAVEPLKEGIRMRLDFTGPLEEAIGDASFALRGSRLAITPAQNRCSLRDMSAYTPVTFTPFTSYMNLARELRKDDIAEFRLSTASTPELVAAMAEFDGSRRVLFTRLCGSSWYYGASGCNITGFAPDATGDGWKAVYDSENVHLHTDPGAVTDGWPDLVTLPARAKGGGAGGPGLIWRWDGNAYALKGELPDDEAEPVAGSLTAQE